ncbi:MAG TPA: DNA recombination protein RmuC [Gaiellaceae bacterium]|jgi:DNA recombination protein RmuC|nr:DNA recombination protein RmuC [Gaiellaceae bacterium]
MVAFAFAVGLAVGALGAYLALRAALAERARLREEALALREALAAARGELEAERRTLDERLAAVVKQLSAQALDESSSRFLELAEAHLAGHVRPLKESLERMDEQLRAVERIRQEAYGALREGVQQLRSDQERLRAETGNLVTALRAPHVRGRWGEIQLRRVIELAGMLEHCDFDEQPSTTDGEGNVLRPDVIVHLPGQKQVVIDSKVPLAAYLDAFREDASDDERRARLADHARHVREHIHRLGQKAYWRQLPATPEFVVMFLPDETFLRAALEQDASLVELAVSNNVIPASPTNLIGLLRAVHYGWQQETVAASAREVSELGRELYKRLATMGGHVARLGKSLDGAVKAYNETVGSLERQVLVQARRFERHGISGVQPPELQPIERQARPLAAPELTPAGEPPLQALPAGADAA